MNPSRCATLLSLTAVCLATGCRAEESAEGTWVGNPGKMAPRVASGERVEISEAYADEGFLWGELCDGSSQDIGNMEPVNLLEEESLDVPPGEWCAFALHLEPEVIFVGTMEDGGSFELVVEDLEVWVETEGGIDSTEAHFLFEIGGQGWLTPEEMGVDNSEHDVVVGPDSEAAMELADTLVREAALFLDEDEDGEVSDTERDQSVVALAPDPEDSDDEDSDDEDSDDEDSDDTGSEEMETVSTESKGCGTCATSGGMSPSALWLVLGAIGVGRRRTAPGCRRRTTLNSAART